MLGLHDAGKRDAAYQANCPLIAADFPPGTTWLCFTDQVLHAALAGHCALEQTFHLPVEAMAHPELTPLWVLERMSGRALHLTRRSGEAAFPRAAGSGDCSRRAAPVAREFLAEPAARFTPAAPRL